MTKSVPTTMRKYGSVLLIAGLLVTAAISAGHTKKNSSGGVSDAQLENTITSVVDQG